jgi:hypothetical protein
MTIQLVIDRFEGDKAVLKFEKEIIVWPKNKIPADAREGSVLNFDIHSDSEKEQTNKKLAKDILNEILGN